MFFKQGNFLSTIKVMKDYYLIVFVDFDISRKNLSVISNLALHTITMNT